MGKKIIMPSAGQTTDTSKIIKWRKNIGDYVKAGEILLEIETDKATMEIESYADGTLLEIYHNEGDDVKAGEVIAYIGDSNENVPDSKNEERPVNKTNNNGDEDYTPIMKEYDEGNQEEKANKEVLASPAARYLARSKNVDLNEIIKESKKDVIKKDDVVKFLEGKSKICDASDDFYYVKMSKMRKTIARRMVESVTIAPHFVISNQVDMTKCIDLRKQLNEYLLNTGTKIKISYNDIIMKCVSKAIEKYPLVNSTLNEDNIKVYTNVNFGLAISVADGIIVTVVKQCNNKSLLEIAQINQNNINKVRNNKIEPEDMNGGTITLSNLGMFDVDEFHAIINQPESCIIAVGKIQETPISVNGHIESRPIMKITGSFDHRIIDGAYAAQFMKDLKIFLENPKLLLL